VYITQQIGYGTTMNAHTATPASPLETAVDFKVLTLNDRCDADSAEAAVAQVIVGGTLLMFCGHHWRVNADVLSQYPHSVPEADSKPMTWRRAQELGAPEQRDAGSSPLADAPDGDDA
jgi:hypothetical protein